MRGAWSGPVRVIGAGIGGLAVATALAQRGLHVAVFEQAEALSEVGAGLQISPNGVRVLRALGLGARLDASQASEAVVLRDFKAGRQVSYLDLARFGDRAGYYALHRADLVDWLFSAAKAAGASFHFGQPVLFSPDDAEITIAADGVKSAHRLAHFNAGQAGFSGQVAWRATVTGDGKVAPRSTVYLGPGRHLVTYPLRAGALINIVAVREQENWADDGWAHADDPAHLRAAFAGFAPDAQRLLGRVDHCFLWGLHNYPVEKQWYKGNMVLIGDAVHPMLPFLAQGANMALEDAWVLASAVSGTGEAAAAFARYQRLRAARVTRVVAASRANARAFHLRGMSRVLAHAALRLGDRVAPGANLRRFRWLYGYDAVSEMADASGGDIFDQKK